MEQYFKKRIKELEDLEIEAINSGNVVEATKLSFAKCELLDARSEFRKINLSQLK